MNKKIEIERKRKLKDAAVVIQALKDAGFKNSKKITETDIYYSRADVDFMKTVECLRIRDNLKQIELTYKPPSTNINHSANSIVSKKEVNLYMSKTDNDLYSVSEFLESLGMLELTKVIKNRQYYHHPSYSDLSVCLDEVQNAGLFIEVEVVSDDIKTAKVTINNIEKALNISGCEVIRLPYRDLVMQVQNV